MHAMIFARRLRILSTLLACFGLLVVGTGCGSPIASVASSPTPSFTASALPTHLASSLSSLSPTPLSPTPTVTPESTPTYKGILIGTPWPLATIETSVPTMAPEGASYTSEQGHFTVTFDRLWKPDQSNALTVTVHEIDEPLILATMIEYPEHPTLPKPLMGDQFEELDGFLFVSGVSSDFRKAHIIFPSEAEAYYFNLRVFLTAQIDLYTLETAPKGYKGGWYTVYPLDVPNQQTVLISEHELLIEFDPWISTITIPNSTETFFQYTPRNAIRDAIALPGDAILEKTQ